MPVRALQLLTVAALLGLWQATARAGWVDPLFVPAPSDVARALVRVSGPALAGLADTLGKTAVAYVLSVTLGVSAGLAIGSVRLLRDVLSPYVIALYGIPRSWCCPGSSCCSATGRRQPSCLARPTGSSRSWCS